MMGGPNSPDGTFTMLDVTYPMMERRYIYVGRQISYGGT